MPGKLSVKLLLAWEFPLNVEAPLHIRFPPD